MQHEADIPAVRHARMDAAIREGSVRKFFGAWIVAACLTGAPLAPGISVIDLSSHAWAKDGDSSGSSGGDNDNDSDDNDSDNDDSDDEDSSNSGKGSSNSGRKGSKNKNFNRNGSIPIRFGRVERARVRGRDIEVRYTDGWREEIEKGSYTLKNARGRTVVSRPARSTDFSRLRNTIASH